MHRVEDLPNWFRAKACSGDVHSKPAPPLRGTLIRHASVVPRECPREESGAASSSSRATRRPPVVHDQASSELARSCRDLPPAGRTGSAGVSTFGSSAECPPVGPGRSRAPSGLECGPTLARRCPCRFRPAPCHRRCRRKREIGAGPSGAGVPDPPRPRPSWGAAEEDRGLQLLMDPRQSPVSCGNGDGTVQGEIGTDNVAPGWVRTQGQMARESVPGRLGDTPPSCQRSKRLHFQCDPQVVDLGKTARAQNSPGRALPAAGGLRANWRRPLPTPPGGTPGGRQTRA
jgi:hypothetical protein